MNRIHYITIAFAIFVMAMVLGYGYDHGMYQGVDQAYMVLTLYQFLVMGILLGITIVDIYNRKPGPEPYGEPRQEHCLKPDCRLFEGMAQPPSSN